MCSLYRHDGISGIGVGSNSVLGDMNVIYTAIAAICAALISLEGEILRGAPGVEDVHLRRDAHARDNHIM